MNKTIQIHIDRITKTRRFEKSEIGALTKLIASYRFADTQRKNDIEALQTETMERVAIVDRYMYNHRVECEVMHFAKPSKITVQQTTLGKNWLNKHCFKLNGETRKDIEDHFSDRALSIARNVSRFEFIGVVMVFDDSGYGKNLQQVLPIYRTYNRKGEYFDYSPIHWAQPIVMEGL
jgi:hypothetical protein